MSLQHRPLTGMAIASGATPPILVSAAGPTTLHQVDATSSPTNFLDQVTLFLLNTGAADQTVDLVVLGVTITVTVLAGEVLKVFDEQPFFGVAGTASSSLITAENTTTQAENVFAYGFFTR